MFFLGGGGGIGTPVAEKVFRHLVVDPKSKTDSVSISLPIFFVSAPIPIFSVKILNRIIFWVKFFFGVVNFGFRLRKFVPKMLKFCSKRRKGGYKVHFSSLF